VLVSSGKTQTWKFSLPHDFFTANYIGGFLASGFQKVWAGQPIRIPVEEKGRFVPASAEVCIVTHAIPVHDSPASPDLPYHKE